ncbi:hypothetical protein L7F22_020260 [Adiantum nelumboides]|nr:hypothetical protein [Adiantum nelumboides]
MKQSQNHELWEFESKMTNNGDMRLAIHNDSMVALASGTLGSLHGCVLVVDLGRYTPKKNGVVECKNRQIVEVAHALMSEKNMPPCYWVEAISIAVYTMNRTPTAVVHDKTPEETFTGKKPNVSHFKVFGCIAYMHVPNELKTKLDPKAKKCVFIGYPVKQKG